MKQAGCRESAVSAYINSIYADTFTNINYLGDTVILQSVENAYSPLLFLSQIFNALFNLSNTTMNNAKPAIPPASNIRLKMLTPIWIPVSIANYTSTNITNRHFL